MERIERSTEVARPLSTVYNQWTQFEDFPRFMEGVEEVRQLDDTHQHWVAKVAGQRREWDAEIVRQEPDRLISWRGFGDKDHVGTVRFDAIGADRTRVTVDMEYEPETVTEKIGDALGLVGRRVDGDLGRFRDFIESRGAETGAWRGEVGGRTESTTPPTGTTGTQPRAAEAG